MRVALLIAAGEYTDPLLRRLRAPAQDVDALHDVLRDPDVGDFAEVRVVVDEARHEVEEAIEGAFADRRPGDVVLVYFTCHGVKDMRGRLYFATTNTRSDRLASTAISSAFVNEQMERSMASAKVALLDCCYSGAFAGGLVPKNLGSGDLARQICGRGSYVITATNSLEYAYEGSGISHEQAISSTFTDLVVIGLATGRADYDGDGKISPTDLYWYLDKEMRAAGHPQTPTSFSSGVQGPVYLAKVRRQAGVVAQPVTAQDAPDAAARHEMERQLRILEARHAAALNDRRQGSRRMRMLDQIAADAGAIAATVQAVGLVPPRVATFHQDDDSARIVTLALCQRAEDPTADMASAVADGIACARSAFEQYWALRAGYTLANKLPPEHREPIFTATRAMLESGVAELDSARHSLAQFILRQEA